MIKKALARVDEIKQMPIDQAIGVLYLEGNSEKLFDADDTYDAITALEDRDSTTNIDDIFKRLSAQIWFYEYK
ncbi:hypothetical protein ESZ50_04800 [Weissella muntiaci]|uniref:Uncharacterized protein n=2 Tax=Weissella muntiaci TaxID=2508881 RepID=A0A6C2C8F8_9LACO|nr:hypothetical protein ESZ50_04800 [Weissella muntiaci]